MEDALKQLTDYTALALEGLSVLLTACGAIEAFLLAAGHMIWILPGRPGWRKDVFGRFGKWLLFALQFALAADIVHTVIAPSWNDIGQLAAIAVIRTFLNHFLEKDMDELGCTGASAPT